MRLYETFLNEAYDDKNPYGLDDLNNIKGIEMRSSCAGHDKDWVSYIVFRPTRKMDLDKVVSKLESDKMTKASAHIGRGGSMRVVVAAKTWYGRPDWKKWWDTLANRVRKSL